VPRFLEGVADLQKERICKRYIDEQTTAHAAMNGWSEDWQCNNMEYKTKIVCVRVYFWRRFSPFLNRHEWTNHLFKEFMQTKFDSLDEVLSPMNCVYAQFFQRLCNTRLGEFMDCYRLPRVDHHFLDKTSMIPC